MTKKKQQKKRKTPNRTCIACRKVKPKTDLIRCTLQDGKPVVDCEGRLGGRGANLCPTKECLIAAIEKGAFNRVWKTGFKEEDLESLKRDFVACLEKRKFRKGAKSLVYRVKASEVEGAVGKNLTRKLDK
ncbi:YlxR family protein [Candidatus Dojkabacteria bacterium]|nr:YlxR family protein [Candidatus Dojkabacteria bacterium]